MSSKPAKGTGATSTTAKGNDVVKKEKLDVNFNTIRKPVSTPSSTTSSHSSDENVNATTPANNNNRPPTSAIISVLTNNTTLTMFDDLSWISVDEEIPEATLRVHQMCDPYKPGKDGSVSKSKFLWISAFTADNQLIKLKSFDENTDRVYQTFKENEIVHITNMKATKVHSPYHHNADLEHAELRIEKNSVVTGIRRQPSAFITENFGDLTQGTNDRKHSPKTGILTAFVKKAEENGKITCMAHVYDRNANRAELTMRFDKMDHATRFDKGSTFVVKGFVNITQGGVMKITAQLEDIEGNVRKENNIPDIKNTCSTPKKAKLA